VPRQLFQPRAVHQRDREFMAGRFEHIRITRQHDQLVCHAHVRPLEGHLVDHQKQIGHAFG